MNRERKLIGKSVSRAYQGIGSFLFIDFGKDIEVSIETKRGLKKHTRGEWELWVYMCFWEFKKGEMLVIHSESSRDEITSFLNQLVHKTLLSFEMLSEKYDAVLNFEGDIQLNLIANKDEENVDQWFLFTPDDD